MKIAIVGKSRYIDADALVEEIQRCSYETWSKDINKAWWAQAVKVKDNIVRCLERQPTADVVEVVRCKDCVWWSEKGFDPILNHHHGCCERPLGEYYECDREFSTGDNDYCSFGERKVE